VSSRKVVVTLTLPDFITDDSGVDKEAYVRNRLGPTLTEDRIIPDEYGDALVEAIGAIELFAMLYVNAERSTTLSTKERSFMQLDANAQALRYISLAMAHAVEERRKKQKHQEATS
jgi:hypothetical protein